MFTNAKRVNGVQTRTSGENIKHPYSYVTPCYYIITLSTLLHYHGAFCNLYVYFRVGIPHLHDFRKIFLLFLRYVTCNSVYGERVERY